MRIPARFAFAQIAAHGAVARKQILDGARQAVPRMRQAVGRGRPFVEDEFRRHRRAEPASFRRSGAAFQNASISSSSAGNLTLFGTGVNMTLLSHLPSTGVSVGTRKCGGRAAGEKDLLNAPKNSSGNKLPYLSPLTLPSPPLFPLRGAVEREAEPVTYFRTSPKASRCAEPLHRTAKSRRFECGSSQNPQHSVADADSGIVLTHRAQHQQQASRIGVAWRPMLGLMSAGQRIINARTP